MSSKQMDSRLRNLATPPEAPATSATTAPVPKPKSSPRPKAESVPSTAPEASGAGGEPPVEPPIDPVADPSEPPPPEVDDQPETFSLQLDELEEVVLGEVLDKLRTVRPVLAAFGLDDPDVVKAKMEELSGLVTEKVKAWASSAMKDFSEIMATQPEIAAVPVPTAGTGALALIATGDWSSIPFVSGHPPATGDFIELGDCLAAELEAPLGVPGLVSGDYELWRYHSGICGIRRARN